MQERGCALVWLYSSQPIDSLPLGHWLCFETGWGALVSSSSDQYCLIWQQENLMNKNCNTTVCLLPFYSTICCTSLTPLLVSFSLWLLYLTTDAVCLIIKLAYCHYHNFFFYHIKNSIDNIANDTIWHTPQCSCKGLFPWSAVIACCNTKRANKHSYAQGCLQVNNAGLKL